MNDEQHEGRTPKAGESTTAHRSRYAEIKRRERLEGAAKSVWLTYQLLRHRAERGSTEYEEFDQKRRHYVEVEKRVGSLTREEQDRILEEYPQLVARLEEEHGL
ncbi:hypothetical protein [Nocardiopsis alborubida]|uniref:Uncharacterized protein n=1 Tax=Nocardiopsis alborubida TaxID=146802 RepID=A0A7X6MFF5_9ACTN|nr:hypothetical protein [Nocardiopsis alborubida]NKY99950.1 hypothetical protein [Nocardiopsis alborubida]